MEVNKSGQGHALNLYPSLEVTDVKGKGRRVWCVGQLLVQVGYYKTAVSKSELTFHLNMSLWADVIILQGEVEHFLADQRLASICKDLSHLTGADHLL